MEITNYLNDVSDPLTQVMMTYGADGNFDAAYTYGLERIVVEDLDETRPESQNSLYYLYDGLGSVAYMVKPDGNMRDHYRYDEYGKPAPGNSKQSPDGDINLNNTFGYTGEMWDEESGLLYLRARYYEPETGRFLSRDTYEGELENPLSKNLYSYVQNNPVNRIDPSGHVTFKIGNPVAPSQHFDEDFYYDPNAKATWEDHVSWIKWGTMLQGAKYLKDMPDAVRAYKHYRDGTGTSLWVDYEKAYKQDSTIKLYIDKLFKIAQNQAQSLHNSSKQTSFNMTSGLYGIPNGSTENWQKTIGAHYVWASAAVTLKNHKYTMKITVHLKDKYNFNKGMSDIASGTPDDVNGRFAVLGWAKSFFTYGELKRTITWAEGKISNTTVIVAPVESR